MLTLALLMQAGATLRLEPLEDVTQQRCETPTTGEVIVCAGLPDRYRLPLPTEREQGDGEGDATRPMTGSGLSAITPGGRCGLFAGERRCGKREALLYGYGGGCDPASVVGRIATGLVDGDAEVESVVTSP